MHPSVGKRRNTDSDVCNPRNCRVVCRTRLSDSGFRVWEIFGFFPFSVTEICLYLLLLILVVSLVHIIVRMIRKDNRKCTVIRYLSRLLLVGSVLMFLYTVNCGVNYKRDSFSEKAGIFACGGTVEELEEVCIRLTEEVNACSALVTRNAAGRWHCSREKVPMQ